MGGCCEAYGTCARITVMMMTAAGLAFSIMAVQSCEFLEFGSTIGGGRDGKAGLFSYTDPNSGACVSYPEDVTIEPTDNTSRVCGALAAIFGLIALVLILFEFCICKLCCARLLEGCVYAVAYICQGLTFLLYNNSTFCTSANTSCNWGQGSVWSVTAFALYLVSAIVICCTPRSDPLLCKHRESKKEEKKIKEEAEKMAEEKEAEDKAAEEAEAGKSASQEEGPAESSSSPAASPAASGAGDEAAAHASAY